MVDLNKIRLTRAALSGRIVIARFGKDETLALDHRDATSEFYQTLVSAAFDGKVPVAGSGAELNFGGGDEQYVALVERKKEGSEQDWCADSVLADTAAHIAGLVGPNDESQAVEKAVSDALRALRGFATMRMKRAIADPDPAPVAARELVQTLRTDELPAEGQAKREARIMLRGLLNTAADEIERFEAKCAALSRSLAAAEAMRPHWAEGYSSDGVAAQVTATALNGLWDLLGTKNQTEAMAKLRSILAERDEARDFGGDALALTEAILLNLGFGCEVSKEPGVDRRRDRIAAVIDKFILDLVLARDAALREKAAALGLVEGHAQIIATLEATNVRLTAALAPLVAIAEAYDDNALDDEARKFWGEHGIVRSDTPPEKVELYAGRGGRRLLTLAQCLAARDAVEPAEAPANVIEVGTAKDLTHWVVDKLFEELVGFGVDPNLIATAMENIADKQEAEGVPVAYREAVAPRTEDVKPLIAALASVVRVQNGNQHADINALLARADAALAATQETNHGR